MRRTARFLLYTLRPCLLILPISVTGAILLLPRIAGVLRQAGRRRSVCALSVFGLLFLLMQGVNLAISALPLALSLGGRRRDLLLGVQLCALLGAGAAVLPWLLPLPALETIPSSLWPRGLLPLVLYSGLALLAVLLGCLSGLLMRRSRLFGGLLYSAGLLLLILLWPACWLILASPAVWGALPLFLLLSLPVSAALLEFPLFRALARLSVR